MSRKKPALKARRRATDRTNQNKRFAHERAVDVEPREAAFLHGKDETMKKTLTVFAALAAGAFAFAPLAGATPLSRPGVDASIEPAHAAKYCSKSGECWWSYDHRKNSYWDDDRGWRQGGRFDEREGHYGRAERDWDRDFDREHGGMRGDDRWSRDMDRDDDRKRMGRDMDRDRERSARGDDWRRDDRDNGMEERRGSRKRDRDDD